MATLSSSARALIISEAKAKFGPNFSDALLSIYIDAYIDSGNDGTEAGIHPRWSQVYAVGPKQEDVKVGQWILVAHGRWSRALKVVNGSEELEVRMVDENDILIVSDEEPADTDVDKKAGYINTGGMRQMTSLPGND